MGDNTDPTHAFGWSLGEGARRQKGGIKWFEGWGGGRYGNGFFTLRNRRLPSPTRINLVEPISSGYPAHIRLTWLEEPVRVASPTRINLEEPVRVASPTRINLEEPIRVASTTRINLEEP